METERHSYKAEASRQIEIVMVCLYGDRLGNGKPIGSGQKDKQKNLLE